MSISVERAHRHVAEQEKRLSRERQWSFWPKFLFHATEVSNAIRILQDGFISARSGVIDFHDVANQGALSAYTGSHDYARLYFRPKNGFHFRTEGIKCRADPFRQNNQMSIPVCFVFKFLDVITRDGVRFSAGNVQKSTNEFLTGDEAFDKLDFGAIYHDSWLRADPKSLDS